MKKLIFALIGALAAVFILLSVLGSNKEYVAEKALYRAGKAQNKIMSNPDVAPPTMVAAVERELRDVLKRYPETNAARAAHMMLVENYMTQKKYSDAVAILEQAITKYDDIAFQSKAHFLKALVYEKMDQWGNSMKEFNLLKTRFLVTPLGMQAPMYIAQHYVNKKDPATAKEQFARAAAFYERLRQEHKGTLMGYAASNLIVQAYMYLDRYEDAGRVVEESILDYPSTLTFVQQMPFIEMIYLDKLKRPGDAIRLYRNIIDKTDDQKIEKYLDEKIGKLVEKK